MDLIRKVMVLVGLKNKYILTKDENVNQQFEEMKQEVLKEIQEL